MVKAATTTKQAELERVKAAILANKVCPDLAKGATNMVFGEGDANSAVVFVGEAPGRQEDLQGRPFVGAAGKLLVGMLESIGLNRQDVYITNVVKYRPPNNRDPLPSEIAAFMPYVKKQLAIIKPKLVVPLGRYAMGLFLPGLTISSSHGQPKRKDGQVYLPLYHPAVALYNINMKKVLEADFAKIPRLIKQIS